MIQVTVTSKYRVTIPKAIRRLLGIREGQKVNVQEHNGVVTLVPEPADMHAKDAQTSGS